MRWRPTPVTAALIPIALALVGNLATNTVEIQAPWWRPVVWVAVVLLILVAVVGDTSRRQPASDLHAIADEFAEVVRKQWQDESLRRDINDPYPLPVHWVAADPELVTEWSNLIRLASRGAGWPAARRKWARCADELAGGDNDLVNIWEKIPTRRLVVLGEPGAGKTMLLVRLVLDVLAPGRRKPGGPVPVLVSIASWDPAGQDLHSWLVERLTLDYPALGRKFANGERTDTLARALLERGLIMLVLDGLDEIPAALRGSAIAGVNQVIQPNQPVIISSRTDAYRDATRPAHGVDVIVAGAAGICLCPLRADDVAAYLRASAGGLAGSRRWDRVAEVMHGRNALAETMSSPLMTALARVIYNPRPGEPCSSLPDPSELLAFATRQDIERHLLDGFVSAAYRPHHTRRTRWRADKVQKWLGYLAHHLEHDHKGATDLTWWRLHVQAQSSRPTIVRAITVGFILLLIAAATSLTAAYSVSADVLIGKSSYVTAATGLTFGIVYWLTGRLNAAMLASLFVIVGGLLPYIPGGVAMNGPTASVDILLPMGLAVGFTYSGKRYAPIGLKAGVRAAVVAGLVHALIGFGTGLQYGLASATSIALSSGSIIGLEVGLIVGLVSRLTASTAPHHRWNASPILAGTVTTLAIWLVSLVIYTIPDGLEAGLNFWRRDTRLTYGLGAGLVVGLGIWLAAATNTPNGGNCHQRFRPFRIGSITAVVFWLAAWLGDELTAAALFGWPERLILDVGWLTAGLHNALRVGILVGLVAQFVLIGVATTSRRSCHAVKPIIVGILTAFGTWIGDMLIAWISNVDELQPMEFSIITPDGLASALMLGLLAGLIARRRMPSPCQWTSNPIVVGLGYGFVYASLYGPTYGFILGLAIALAVELARRLIRPRNPAQSLRWTRSGLAVGALAGAVAGILTGYRSSPTAGLTAGLTVGCAIGLVAAIDAPQDLTTLRAPARVLATDRTTFTSITITSALAVFVTMAITSGIGPRFALLGGIPQSVGLGVAIGVIVAAGRTAWVRYLVARGRLAVTGVAPWSLMAFLSDAHLQRGILRQNGATYQFRHLELQRHLAATYQRREPR